MCVHGSGSAPELISLCQQHRRQNPSCSPPSTHVRNNVRKLAAFLADNLKSTRWLVGSFPRGLSSNWTNILTVTPSKQLAFMTRVLHCHQLETRRGSSRAAARFDINKWAQEVDVMCMACWAIDEVAVLLQESSGLSDETRAKMLQQCVEGSGTHLRWAVRLSVACVLAHVCAMLCCQCKESPARVPVRMCVRVCGCVCICARAGACVCLWWAGAQGLVQVLLDLYVLPALRLVGGSLLQVCGCLFSCYIVLIWCVCLFGLLRGLGVCAGKCVRASARVSV